MTLQRIFMTIRRGITDATAVCVFPWEKSIIEEIHGANAEVKTIDELCDVLNGAKVTEQKIKFHAGNPDKLLTLRQQYEYMSRVDEDTNPLDNLDAEYDRLHMAYGMHRDLPLANVEKVYGNVQNFRKVARDFAAGRMPEMFNDGSGDVDDETPIAEMTIQQLRRKASEMGLKFYKKSREEIEASIIEAMDEKQAA